MNKPVHPSDLAHKILMFLARQKGDWCTWGESFYMNSVQQVFPVGTTPEVQQRYMRILQHKKLVGGCNCGCRGDYALTPKGLDALSKDSILGENQAVEYIRNKYCFAY